MLFCVKTIITDFQPCRSDGQEVKVEAAEKVEFEKHRNLRRLSPIYHSVPSPGELFQVKLKIKDHSQNSRSHVRYVEKLSRPAKQWGS